MQSAETKSEQVTIELTAVQARALKALSAFQGKEPESIAVHLLAEPLASAASCLEQLPNAK